MTSSMPLTFCVARERLRGVAVACGLAWPVCGCAGAAPPRVAEAPRNIEPAVPSASSTEVASKPIEPSRTEPSTPRPARANGQEPECPDDYVKCMQTGPEAKCRQQYAACGGHLY